MSVKRDAQVAQLGDSPAIGRNRIERTANHEQKRFPIVVHVAGYKPEIPIIWTAGNQDSTVRKQPTAVCL